MYYPWNRIVSGTIAVIILGMVASPLLAQRPSRRNTAGGPFSILRDDALREELDLDEEQWAQLQEMASAIRSQMREQFSGLNELPAQEREAQAALIREQMQSIRSEFASQLEEILLPHQLERLRQVEFQRQMNRGSTAEALSSDRIAEELGLSEEQREEILELGEEVQAELEEEIASLREEARQRLFELLTPQQRQQLEDLTGEPFEESERERRQPRDRRGDRERDRSANQPAP